MANLSDVDFSFIRYANVWEDADNLLQALAVPEGGRIFSIASGGDNALALLLKNPRQLVVADVSHVQLYVTELKIRAIEQLCHAETLAFLGFRESGDRINCLSRIKPFLTLPCAAYFTANSDLIRDGIIHAGKFERYFSLFRRYVLPLTQPEKNIEGLLRLKSPAEQRRFYAQYWDNWRWRLLFKVFFSRFVMGRLGRDPKFYAQAGHHTGRAIHKRAERHLASASCQTNEFLHYILTGRFGSGLPVYLRRENFETIKKRLPVIEIVRDTAENVCGRQPFEAYNLSNIFEYMPQDYFEATARKMAVHIPGGGRLAYWNLLVDRRLSRAAPQLFGHDASLSERLTGHDKGFFYQTFIVETRLPKTVCFENTKPATFFLPSNS